ncbi:DMT family transporter [Actinoplanes sp. NPDC048967]|uniref:DMT family transporter n=1 Tax=Actinoplanes sp. NPDC048967 TaxID=3155269 RepID=UPI0033D45070
MRLCRSRARPTPPCAQTYASHSPSARSASSSPPLAITVVFGLLRAAGRTPPLRVRPLAAMPRWGWLGGVAAAVYVTVTLLLIPRIGAATTVTLAVTGQQLAPAVIDHFGLFRLPPRALTRTRFGGLAALAIGCALVQFA